MTRPSIIRADTIDLQDPGSPSASDHTRQPTQPAPLGIGPAAPHQTAAVKNVEDERAAEEEGLVRAWNGSAGEDHGADPNDITDDGEMADSETEDMEDDMLDKISSSPSIDDGRYSLPSLSAHYASAWPPQSPSLSATPMPATPPQQDYIDSSESDLSSSSPFTMTPQHLPLSFQPVQHQSAPSNINTPLSSPPFLSPPIHLPVRMGISQERMSFVDHHRLSEYTGTGPADSYATPHEDPHDFDGFEDGLEDCVEEEEYYSSEEYVEEAQDSVGPLFSKQYEQAFYDNEFNDEDDDLPVFRPDRPLPEIPASDSSNSLNGVVLAPRTGSPTASSAAWETDSYASSWYPEEDDDDSKDVFFPYDLDRTDSAYGGECLREAEDIDFEFVYALHTFVATVEGQANATKGDTMVLLDDSNSYWWLVRIVKDSSIGYLPAEHIETPTERLARLNKHRNIDLSAAMLGDSAEKSKNPLKKAMRRRNAKTVQFTAPTYVEASDYDYSSDEEEGDSEVLGNGHGQDEEDLDEEDEDRDKITVEPLRIGGSKEKKADDAEPKKSDESKNSDEKPRNSDEMFDRPLEQKISRNGTVRNTDSFFKDDTVETRKITLTPNILRDDTSASSAKSVEGRERGSSLDSLEKELKSPERVKDDKKKKEKKPGMLRGLFGRKDKKSKSADNEPGEEKQSEELSRDSFSRDSEDTGSPKEQPKTENESSQQQQPVRQTSKGGKSSGQKANGPQKQKPDPNAQPAKSILQTSASNAAAEATMRLVSAEAEAQKKQEQPDASTANAKEPEVEQQNGRARSGSTSAKQAISNMLHSKSSEQKQENKMPPREKVKKSKQRAPLDDFDSTPEWEQKDPFADPDEEEMPQDSQQQQHHHQALHVEDIKSRAPASHGDISPIDTDHPPALVHDASSQEEPDISPVSPSGSPTRGDIPIASPTTAGRPGALNTNIPPMSAHSPTMSNPPSANSLPAWSDASLRSYLDDGSDIRDMLVVVNDTSGVVPVGPDHPIMAGLFNEERSKVAEMGMQLDSLLGDWLSRKRRTREKTFGPESR